MSQTLIEMTKDLVCSMIAVNALPAEDLQAELHRVHDTMMRLRRAEASGQDMATPEAAQVMASGGPPAVDWKKSIQKRTITCLECGATFRQLSRRHLDKHGLNPRSYRHKYGMPPKQALSAREVTIRRRQAAKDIRPWEQARAQAKTRKGTKK